MARYVSDIRVCAVLSYAIRETHLESHGPLGVLWVGLGLGCFYVALIWLNTLLGFFLTPLFTIPSTWMLDRVQRMRGETPRR